MPTALPGTMSDWDWIHLLGQMAVGNLVPIVSPRLLVQPTGAARCWPALPNLCSPISTCPSHRARCPHSASSTPLVRS